MATPSIASRELDSTTQRRRTTHASGNLENRRGVAGPDRASQRNGGVVPNNFLVSGVNRVTAVLRCHRQNKREQYKHQTANMKFHYEFLRSQIECIGH